MGGPRINAKIGPIGEMGVAFQLIKRGWCVCAPMVFDTLQHFDLIACRDEVIHRIQVKSTSKMESGTSRYTCISAMGRNRKTKYSKQHCDFLIAAINPLETYFVFPVESVRVPTLRFPSSFSEDHRYAPYHEAWHLLEG